MAQRHQPAPVGIAGQVEDDRAQVRGCLVRIFDAMRIATETNEGLLHDVLSGVSVVHEETGETHQRSCLSVEQIQHRALLVGLDMTIGSSLVSTRHEAEHGNGHRMGQTIDVRPGVTQIEEKSFQPRRHPSASSRRLLLMRRTPRGGTP